MFSNTSENKGYVDGWPSILEFSSSENQEHTALFLFLFFFF